jgi:hypothetical protein
MVHLPFRWARASNELAQFDQNILQDFLLLSSRVRNFCPIEITFTEKIFQR